MVESIPKDDLVNEIHRLADDDNPPTLSKLKKSGNYSHTAFRTQFGSWNNALRECGYTPNQRITERELLEQLASETNGSIAPKRENHRETNNSGAYHYRFNSWWQACVRAGLKPVSRRPVTPTQYRAIFESATSQADAERQLITLLFQFTGLTADLIPKFSRNWITNRAGDMIITVPETETLSQNSWTFQVPSTWSDGGRQRETGLPGLLDWYFDHYQSIQIEVSNIHNTLHRVLADTELKNRESITRPLTGPIPLVRPGDLRATSGVKMARNSAPPRRIRRHLGIEHTGWNAEVEDFFLWLYVHEDFEHPDYGPPDVVLNPV